jgi:hypothetical protein
MMKPTVHCVDPLNEPLCIGAPNVMLIIMPKLEFVLQAGKFERHFPLLIIVLLFAAGDYASLIRQLRLFL